MGTPWTAPAWMKDNFSMKSGQLKDDHLDDYALYLVRYMKAFRDEGFPIYAITMQNEPLHYPNSYPSMQMPWYTQSNLIKYHLGPLMNQENLNTKVLLYDHNWDNTNYARDILSNSGAAQYAAGTAFHGYAGNVTDQSVVYNHNQNKGIWFTEQSGTDLYSNFGDNLRWYAENLLIGSIQNWSKSVLFWNLALDTNNGPKNGGCSDCRGVVTVNNNGSFTKEVEYYALGHMSKFVDPGARRVRSTLVNDIINVAFRNPDGTFVLVAFNKSNNPRFFRVRHNQKQFGYFISGGALVTFKRDPTSNSRIAGEEPLVEGLVDETLVGEFAYPNPASDAITLDLSKDGLESARFTLVNLQGQVIYEHFLTEQKTKISLDDSVIPGLYFAYLDAEGFAKKMKIIIN